MTNQQLAEMAKRLWNHGDQSTQQHNQKAWVKAVQRLGDKWLIYKPYRPNNG